MIRLGDRVHTVCELYDRNDQQLVREGTAGTVAQISMFGRRLLVDDDNGVSLRHHTCHCRRS